jgi:hypothetical protein
MANNKYAGFTPKYKDGVESTAQLDKFNPFEFRKGMDYELTNLGCLRLAESTPEEREKATETVLKNLENNGGYYTSLITYETLFRNIEGSKPSFTSWLKEQDNIKMQEVNRGDEDSKHKDDKMEEPKYKKEDYTTTFRTKALKEAIKYRLQRKILAEAKKEKDEDEELDKKAGKGAKKGSKKLSIFDKEREAIEKHLEDLKEKKEKELEKYKSSKKDKKAVEDYKKSIELSEKDKKKLEKTAEKYDVPSEEYIAKDIPGTIKDLEKRLKAIDKDEEAAVAKLREEKNEIAATDMTREEQIRLLNILKEKGVSLREGSEGIKVYYEIAKTAFLEGLSKGMGI